MSDESKPSVGEAFSRRVDELMGGPYGLLDSLAADSDALKAKWNKDVVTIGRILRAHLHVEHYLTKYLQHLNPGLSDRRTFSQKANMLTDQDPKINFLRPGIKHLNKIRNRLAHDLEATVTEDDSAVFLAPGLFKWSREASAGGADSVRPSSPIDVLEEFATFASLMLQEPTTRSSKTFAQVLKELGVEKNW